MIAIPVNISGVEADGTTYVISYDRYSSILN